MGVIFLLHWFSLACCVGLFDHARSYRHVTQSTQSPLSISSFNPFSSPSPVNQTGFVAQESAQWFLYPRKYPLYSFSLARSIPLMQPYSFPPVRACLFDMDGLLIDTEDIYTDVVNIILRENNRPLMPWSIKARLQGRPGPAVSS